ncbi:MAG: exodeoxyribonuclease VII large subunit [Candidatus Omnitrophica bacterium]|nr:exodeoxyribonuclease VII large subunit [Candidatus Omnitrophota bacterium]
MTDIGLAPENKVYSITELTRDISLILENSFKNIWVEGEVSNLVLHSSGHCYLSLKDADSVLGCVIFKHQLARLKFTIENGLGLICSGRIGVYGKRGQYQLYIDKAEPKGIGSLQAAYEQLKKKLYNEGLFDESAKKPIPKLAGAIGVITSPTGAAIRDILNIINRRYENTHIIILPVKVQGQGAANEIVRALSDFNRLKNVDVIILARGGGSIEDLWAFNEELVARAIYDSSIPVISAVGHEIDYTISDFVSDLRAPTPSAAAELVIGRKEDMISDIEKLKDRLKRAAISRVRIMQDRLDGVKKSYAFRQPLFMAEQYQQRFDETLKRMIQALVFFTRSKHQSFTALKNRLEALSPDAILRRGFSITMRAHNGSIIKDASDLASGALIRTRFLAGEIISRVEKP